MSKLMKHEEFSFTSPADRITIACYRWPASAKARAVLQVSHGMGEHALRYAPLAEFLAGHGFHTYANDHRGHGRTGQPTNSLGDFGKAGWNGLVDLSQG